MNNQMLNLDKGTELITEFSKRNSADLDRAMPGEWKGPKTHRSGLKRL